jgi:putative transposase
MLKAYKYRLYPTRNQKISFAKTFGCVRFVYNKMLSDRKQNYEENKELDVKDIKYPTPAQYKSEFPWLKEVDSLALANAQLNLNKAYSNFFRRLKKREKEVGFPKFKSRHNNNNYNYTTNNQGETIRLEGNRIKLPKIGFVKLKLHRKFNGLVKSATISQTPSGKYFISILVDTENIQLKPAINKVGIDLGIKTFAVLSTGEIIDNPKYLRNSEVKLAQKQKSLSRKTKGSNNRRKARLQVAKIYEKITNQKKDFLHKLTHRLLRENQVIVIEDLGVKDMMQNHRLAKSIAEVSWAEFRGQLEYKAKWFGREIVIAPRDYASSQLCSGCGNKSDQTKDLSCRTYKCEVCGLEIDRDYNASLNLLKLIPQI